MIEEEEEETAEVGFLCYISKEVGGFSTVVFYIPLTRLSTTEPVERDRTVAM